MAVSAVHSADGAGVDLDELRTAAEAAGARVLVDVSQGAGGATAAAALGAVRRRRRL